MKIVPATGPEQLRQVRLLFEEYAALLPFDLCFQNFRAELDGLPGGYAPPEGGLWPAITDTGEAAGGVAPRRLKPGTGEMKRLYVRPERRGTGLGQRLARKVLEEAVRSALKTGAVRLTRSTAVANATAQALYERDGWRRDTAFLHYGHGRPKGGG